MWEWYECESWTVKKAEHQRIDAFELWCWRRLLRVPWTARRSNQSILKEISPGYSLEGLMLQLKLQYCGHLMRIVDSLEKTLMLGEGTTEGWDGWMASPTRWTWVWMNSGSWWWTGKPGVLQFMGSQRVGHNSATELNWTKTLSWISLRFGADTLAEEMLTPELPAHSYPIQPNSTWNAMWCHTKSTDFKSGELGLQLRLH